MTTKVKIKDQIKEVLEKYLNLKHSRVFIFGSQANLEELKRADIDVGVEADEPLSYEKLLKIKNDLDNLSTLYTIDLVDFNEADDSFKKIALKNIEIL